MEKCYEIANFGKEYWASNTIKSLNQMSKYSRVLGHKF